MGATTEISWADATFNLWWGCTKVGGSPACEHCYAEAWAKRTGFNVWGNDAPRRYFREQHLGDLQKWDAQARATGTRKRVFVMSMGDWAEGRPEQKPVLEQFYAAADKLTNIDLLLLTKRPQLIRSLLPPSWLKDPRPHVWMGTTAETQAWMDLRWDHLLRVPAAVYWFSIEPVWERLQLPASFLQLQERAWAIAGGESGGHAQPTHPNVFRSIRDQTVRAGVPFHFKQHGEWLHESQVTGQSTQGRRVHEWEDGSRSYLVGKKAAGHLLDGQIWQEFPASAVREEQKSLFC